LSVDQRTGQDRTGQDRTGQDRTGQDRTGQGWKGEKNEPSSLSIVLVTKIEKCSEIERGSMECTRGVMLRTFRTAILALCLGRKGEKQKGRMTISLAQAEDERG